MGSLFSCATCRRSCGLSASPRATTCAACAGLGISRRLLQATCRTAAALCFALSHIVGHLPYLRDVPKFAPLCTMPDSFFYETNRKAFLICATCRRFCGLSASPRATTCAACAGLGIFAGSCKPPPCSNIAASRTFGFMRSSVSKTPEAAFGYPLSGFCIAIRRPPRRTKPTPKTGFQMQESDESDSFHIHFHSYLEILLSDSPVKRR